MKALREFLKPEFLSRLDEIIVFNSLTKEDFIKIAEIILKEYVESLAEHDIKFSYNKKALKLLAEKSFGGKSGARDLRNLIRKEVEDKLSLLIIQNSGFDIGDVSLTAKDENLELTINKN